MPVNERAMDDNGRAVSAKMDARHRHRADDVQPERWPIRVAAPADAEEVARLLHDFNVEFAAPTPGVGVLADRLRRLLAGEETLAILAGSPAVAVALVTLRPNVWFAGPVALLDELYVHPPSGGAASVRPSSACC
jgi:hypothetical protein